MCPACADAQLREALPDAPTSTGRVALVTGARVKIGYQAALKLLRAGAQRHRHHALPARRRAALRARARLRRLAATGCRSTASTCATRRASRSSARYLERDARPARHPHQQRLPDRAPAARLLRAPARARGAAAAARCPRSCSRSLRAPPRVRAPRWSAAPRLAAGDGAAPRASAGSWPGAAAAPASASAPRRGCRRSRYDFDDDGAARPTSSPRARSTPICSRSTCARRTPGG